MNFSTDRTRLFLGIGLAGGAVALVINLIDWWRGSLAFAGPKLMDQFGFLLLIGAALLTPSRQKIQYAMLGIGLLLCIPSTLLIFGHFWHLF